MAKLGEGIDLFEFINRRKFFDEGLGSYIFQQLVEAVAYIHSMNIVNGNIEDENIIFDQNFHIQLIDFGAAEHIEPDTLFTKFYGTNLFCCPELLYTKANTLYKSSNKKQ